MAQFARPSADTFRGTWTNDAGGSTNIFQAIDEVAPSDADFVQSVTAPANAPYVTKLSTGIEDPQTGSGHVVRYRYQKDAAGGAQIDLTVQLRQGYSTEASPGTLIASASNTNIPNGWSTGAINLSTGEADSITNYDSLYLRFVANQV